MLPDIYFDATVEKKSFGHVRRKRHSVTLFDHTGSNRKNFYAKVIDENIIFVAISISCNVIYLKKYTGALTSLNSIRDPRLDWPN